MFLPHGKETAAKTKGLTDEDWKRIADAKEARSDARYAASVKRDIQRMIAEGRLDTSTEDIVAEFNVKHAKVKPTRDEMNALLFSLKENKGTSRPSSTGSVDIE